MNMKWFKKYVLPAILAATVPITANAAVFELPVINWTSPDVQTTYPTRDVLQAIGVNVGATISTQHTWTWDGTTTTVNANGDTVPVYTQDSVPFTGTPATGDTFTFKDINISTEGKTGYMMGVNTTFADATYNLGNITLSKTGADVNGNTQGFVHNGAAAFAGSVNGKVVNVQTSTIFTTDGLNDSYGVRFMNGIDAGDNTIHFDEIYVDAAAGDGTAGGTAFNVLGNLKSGDITVGKITMIGDVWANGLHFQNAFLDPDATATMKVDSLTVRAKQNAHAVLFANGGENPTLYDSATWLTLGKVSVNSEAGNAIAIEGKNLSGLILTDNVEGVTNDPTKEGTGIKSAEDLAYTVADGKQVEISGTGGPNSGGTNSGGNTTSTTGKGAKQTVHGTVAGGKVISGGDGTSVFSDGFQANGLEQQGNSIVEYYQETGDSLGAVAGDIIAYANGEEELQYGSLNGTILKKAETGDQLLTDNGSGSVTITSTGTTSLGNGFIAAASIHQRYSAWNAVRDQMISATGNRRGFLGQECDPCDPICDTDPCDPCDPCGTFGGGFGSSLARNAWVNYVGRGDEYNAAVGGKWKLGMDGVQVGTDLYKTRHNQFGVIFGYEGGNLTNNSNRDNIKADDMYAGIYGAHVFRGGVDIRGSFTYGWQDYEMVRDRLFDHALFGSKFDGKTTESTVEIGKRFFNGNWSMRPVFGVDVMSNDLDQATEYDLAGNAGYTYGKTDFTQVFLRAGTDLRWQLRRLTFNSGIYYSYDVNGDDLIGYAQNGANTPIKMVGSDMGRELLTFNVGGEYQLGKCFSVFGGYQGQSVLDTDSNAYQSVGYVGGAWKW